MPFQPAQLTFKPRPTSRGDGATPAPASVPASTTGSELAWTRFSHTLGNTVPAQLHKVNAAARQIGPVLARGR